MLTASSASEWMRNHQMELATPDLDLIKQGNRIGASRPRADPSRPAVAVGEELPGTRSCVIIPTSKRKTSDKRWLMPPGWPARRFSRLRFRAIGATVLVEDARIRVRHLPPHVLDQ